MNSKPKALAVVFSALMLMLPAAFAATGDTDGVFTPIQKIYDLIYQFLPLAALIAFSFCGYKYMTAGDDPREKDSAKKTFGGVVMGVMIVLCAPALVTFLTGITA